jgi:predicted metalloprotease with PDZ domain
MDVIGPTMVRIAAPRGHSVQRVPMLSLIRAVLPLLQDELAAAPPYLLIVSAGDPMWRGGLSAPNSVYLHADRPIIGENGTSTLVHELVHLLAPVPTDPDHDWIDEGVAEYLGLVLLHRSGAISTERFDHAIDIFRRQGAKVSTMLTRNSSGAVNARAVVIFHDLDLELRKRTGNSKDIFDLVALMMKEQMALDVGRLRLLAAQLTAGQPLQSLSPTRVPGAR